MLGCLIKERNFSRGFIKSSLSHKKTGKEHFETIMINNQYMNHGLTIVPQKNMVLNIGLTGDATHTSAALECLPKGYRKIFELNTYDITTPLKKQQYVIEDYTYKKRAYRVYGWGNLGVKFYRQLESLLLAVKYGQIKNEMLALRKKIKKLKDGTIS